MEENVKRLNEIVDLSNVATISIGKSVDELMASLERVGNVRWETVHHDSTKAHKKMIKAKRSESRKNKKLKKRGLYNKAEAKKRMDVIDDNFIFEIEKITHAIPLTNNVKIEPVTFMYLGDATINGSNELKNAYAGDNTQPVDEQLESVRELENTVEMMDEGNKESSGIIGKLLNGYKKLANFFNE